MAWQHISEFFRSDLSYCIAMMLLLKEKNVAYEAKKVRKKKHLSKFWHT